MRIKKGIALLLASCLTLGLMGCSNKKTQETPPSESGDINLITNGSFDENIRMIEREYGVSMKNRVPVKSSGTKKDNVWSARLQMLVTWLTAFRST